MRVHSQRQALMQRLVPGTSRSWDIFKVFVLACIVILDNFWVRKKPDGPSRGEAKGSGENVVTIHFTTLASRVGDILMSCPATRVMRV